VGIPFFIETMRLRRDASGSNASSGISARARRLARIETALSTSALCSEATGPEREEPK
jgi:hypothetical protein